MLLFYNDKSEINNCYFIFFLMYRNIDTIWRVINQRVIKKITISFIIALSKHNKRKSQHSNDDQLN